MAEPVDGRERVGTRRRGVRRLSILLIVGLVGSTAGVAWAGRAKVSVLRPAPSVCTGSKIKVGVRKRANPSRYRIEVRNPAGSLVFSKRGKARRKLQTWSVALPSQGTYRVVYRTYRKTFRYATSAVTCEDQAKVRLSIDDEGMSSLNLVNAAPGDRTEACVEVSYSGTLPAEVRLYGSGSGEGLEGYLQLTVTRGSLPPGESGSCAGFEPDPVDHRSYGPGVIFTGLLADLPGEWSGGIVDPSPGDPEVWTDGERRAYRLSVELLDDQAAQGLEAGHAFTWEARSA